MFGAAENQAMKQQLKPREASEHNQIRSISISKVQNGFVIYVERYNPDGHYYAQNNQYIANNVIEVLNVVNVLIEKDNTTSA